jgi:hypothetical protein
MKTINRQKLSTIHIVAPFESFILHPFSQLLLATLGIITIFSGIKDLLCSLDGGVSRSTSYRWEGENSDVWSIEFLRHGCPVLPEQSGRTGGMTTFAFPPHTDIDEVRANLVTPAPNHTITFALLGLASGSSSSPWRILASSSTRCEPNPAFSSPPSDPQPRPPARTRPLGPHGVAVLFPWPLPWHVENAARLVLAAGLGILCPLGALRTPLVARAAFALAAAALAAAAATAAAGYAAAGLPHCALAALLACPCYGGLLAALWLREGLVAEAGFLAGLGLAAAPFAAAAALPTGCADWTPPRGAPVIAPALAVLGAAAALARRRWAAGAERAVRGDAAAHGAAWAAVVADPGERRALRELEAAAAAAAAAAGVPAAALRQDCLPLPAAAPPFLFHGPDGVGGWEGGQRIAAPEPAAVGGADDEGGPAAPVRSWASTTDGLTTV